MLRLSPKQPELRFVVSLDVGHWRVTATAHPELGPRSLAPDHPFWGAFDELIWDPTSPADFCNYCDVRALGPRALTILAGTDAVTSFRF